MNDDICLIPRNLRKPDTIIQSPIKLTMKQLLYIGAGIGGAYIAYSSGLPMLGKILIVSGSVSIGLIGGLFKYEGSSIDELAVDSIVYAQRKIYYKQLSKRGEVVVTISSRKEETTINTIKPVSFSI